ncbi:MAG: hypothetical protein LBE21_00295 [Pseudomonadales bacterium]|nr:hypothetical protein [Pseudomonadales bacterium]
MQTSFSRRKILFGMAGTAGVAATGFAAEQLDFDALRSAYQEWMATLPTAPEPRLANDGLAATELARWRIMEANQGVAVDAEHFYGIGNHALVKHRKDTGERVREWFGPRGGSIIHFNSGWVEGKRLTLAHSNFSQLPMASSLEVYDADALQPLESYSLGIRFGSLTWAVRHQGFWWACFANYNNGGGIPGFDQRWSYVAQFDDQWQQLQSWLFPPQVIATWGESSCSGGDWGDDGLLYVTGHDTAQLHVLRLPKQGVMLDYVTTIDVPFEGQSWAWDRGAGRVIYGISRQRQEIIAARIPDLPATV